MNNDMFEVHGDYFIIHLGNGSYMVYYDGKVIKTVLNEPRMPQFANYNLNHSWSGFIYENK